MGGGGVKEQCRENLLTYLLKRVPRVKEERWEWTGVAETKWEKRRREKRGETSDRGGREWRRKSEKG